MKNLLVIFLALFSGCIQPENNSNNLFIVPVRSLQFNKTQRNELPPPIQIQSYYLRYNFIIDIDGKVYFYQQEIDGSYCGIGIEWNTPPSFIDLRPNDILEIPSEQIEQFIKSNILYLKNSERLFAIASTADTIFSAGLYKIFIVLKDTSNHIDWVFRKTTQEENVVLRYKKNNKTYYAEEIKWDSTKTLFYHEFSPY